MEVLVTDVSLLCDYDKGKGKVVPLLFLTEHHAMKAYQGSEGIAKCILYVGTRWR
jgi:hypothetical protein